MFQTAHNTSSVNFTNNNLEKINVKTVRLSFFDVFTIEHNW